MFKINPIQGVIDFHFKIVSEILDKIIHENIGKGLLLEATRKFIKRYKNILVKGEPYLLLKVNQKFNTVITNQDIEKLKICFSDRGYKAQLQKKYGKEYLNLLNIDTCVYCNRNYTLDVKNLKSARAQLDHWFPKTEFPLLSLSFYNLIPSCGTCNHIKGNGDQIIKSKFLNNETATKIEIQEWWNSSAIAKLNHPYFHENKFRFSFNYVNFNNFNSKIKVKVGSKTDNTLKFNNINEIYNTHSQKELKDLLDLRYKYSQNYLDILINNTFKELSISKEETYRMIFGIEIKEEDSHIRPFSKFKKDIIEELLRIK